MRFIDSDGPSRKRLRVENEDNNKITSHLSAAENARKEVGEVFRLWEEVHGTLDDAPAGLPIETVTSRIQHLGKGEAGMLALAACWKGFTRKV
jgi:hypothetical protein